MQLTMGCCIFAAVKMMAACASFMHPLPMRSAMQSPQDECLRHCIMSAPGSQQAHHLCSILSRCHQAAMLRAGAQISTVRQCAGAASRSFTSTAVNVTTANKRKMIRVERTPKAKAYLRLHTSLGDLNLELHCDIAPRACENFLVLLESGYYNNTIFHRSIRNFMIQVQQ